MFFEEGNLLRLIFLGFSFFILVFSYSVTNILASRIKLKAIKVIYDTSPNTEAKSFLFRLGLQAIEPIIFILLSFVIAFFSFTLIHYFESSVEIFKKIPHTITISTTSLTIKLGLLWLVYRFASLSSVNKFVNKFVILVLFCSALFNFLDFNNSIATFLGKFKANFGSFEVSIYKICLIIIILLGAFWFNKVVLELVKRILNNVNVSPNARALFVKLFSLFLFISIFLIGLASIGFDLTSLAIFGSALAVGLGFGFQKIVSNFISGVTISIEEIIKEGDVISIDDRREIRGIVKALHMRYVLIAEFDGKEVMIPNDTIVTSNIANLTHSNNHLRDRINLLLPRDIDLHTFRDEVIQIVLSNPYISKIAESACHVDFVNEAGIGIFILYWIDDPIDVNIAKTTLLLQIIDYLREKDITIPPQITKLQLDKKH